MAAITWHSRCQDSFRELETARLPSVPVIPGEYHPLKSVTVIETKRSRAGGHKGSSSSLSSSSSSSFLDPLSQILDGSDPLSQLALSGPVPSCSIPTDSSIGRDKESRRRQDCEPVLGTDFEPWAQKRRAILARYTTKEKLSINFCLGLDKGQATSRAGQGNAMSEKMRSRLEELDDMEEGSQRELLSLTQQEYASRIKEQDQALREAWATDQKVKALKIVIQCSKLLSDMSVMQFYPSKFVLVTDNLDTFGSSNSSASSPDPISPNDVPDSAKETCINWFHKIASIRELVPRFYVEAAILRCSKLISADGFAEALPRLANTARGIGDPLVAVYARAYLCRVGVEGAPHLRELLAQNFFDFLQTMKQLHVDSVQNLLALQGLDMSTYLTLYSPAIDWILQCVAYHASEHVLLEVMDHCRKLGNNALLLNSILCAFQPQFIAARTMAFISMIKECDDNGFPMHLLYRSLGQSLAVADPPEEERLQVLNDAWKVVTRLHSTQDYISCAEVWMEYACRCFTAREVNTILADIIKHMTPDRAFEDAYPQLQSIIARVLKYFHDFTVLFSMDKFLPFLDMFQKESVKVDVCKSIVEDFILWQQQQQTRDPVIINAMMFVCKAMHDSISALTLEDEKRSISFLICGFIQRISFGRDFEQQLSFYVESRGTFSNLEPVLVHLVQSVNRLSMDTHRVMNGNHSHKTAAFVRACAAYSFITIPSLTASFPRLNLYLLSGQVALTNQCLAQADAFFKAAIALVAEIPRTVVVDGKARPSEGYLLEYVRNLLSALLVVPDHPEQGVLCLTRGLLTALQQSQWDEGSDGRVMAYISVLHLLCASTQESYLYTVDKVDSNDQLYGGDPKFIQEVNSLCETIVGLILDHLKVLGKEEQTLKRQASVALALFSTLVSRADLQNNRLRQLAVNLWGLARKHGFAEPKITVPIMKYLKGQAERRPELGDLAQRLAASCQP
uniref:VPS35 endosomal protein-sorting factor-like isoform X2 n=1 Tax=Myxine glutinosa TaxID=7769 RepID=UPI00358F8339